MRRLALGALALIAACTACIIRPKAQPLWPRHNVRVVWVHDSVMRQMQVAADDTVEAMFQVLVVGTGQICPPTASGDQSCNHGTAADSGYLILAVVQCPTSSATTYHIAAHCPNPYAPTIHIHPHHGEGFGDTGNNCSPSPPDYAYQLTRRHWFDGILCGSNTRPTIFFFWQNPLLGTAEFPDTLTPIVPGVRPLQ